MIRQIYEEAVRRVMDKNIHKRIKKDDSGQLWIDRHVKIRQDLWDKCEKLGFNRSALINELLEEFLTLYESFKRHKQVGPPRFELGSPAPQAERLPGYPTAPAVINWRMVFKGFCYF